MLGSRSLGSLALGSALLEGATTIQHVGPKIVFALTTKQEAKILTSKKQGPEILDNRSNKIVIPKGKNKVIRLTNKENRQIPI